MRLSLAAQDVIQRYAEKFPLPATDEGCREWTGRLAEQFRFSFGPSWGWKRADPYRPLSNDVIAYRSNDSFLGYDVILGAGAAGARVVIDPDPIDLAGQVFVVVEPVDRLGTGNTVPVPTPEPGDCKFQPTDLSAVLARLEALEVRQTAVEAAIDDMDAPIVAALTRPFPSYVGKLLGFKVVLRPEV